MEKIYYTATKAEDVLETMYKCTLIIHQKEMTRDMKETCSMMYGILKDELINNSFSVNTLEKEIGIAVGMDDVDEKCAESYMKKGNYKDAIEHIKCVFADKLMVEILEYFVEHLEKVQDVPFMEFIRKNPKCNTAQLLEGVKKKRKLEREGTKND